MFIRPKKEMPKIQILDRTTDSEGRTLYQIKWLRENDRITWEHTHDIKEFYDLISKYEYEISSKQMDWNPLPQGVKANGKAIQEKEQGSNSHLSIDQYLKKVNNRKKPNQQPEKQGGIKAENKQSNIKKRLNMESGISSSSFHKNGRGLDENSEADEENRGARANLSKKKALECEVKNQSMRFMNSRKQIFQGIEPIVIDSEQSAPIEQNQSQQKKFQEISQKPNLKPQSTIREQKQLLDKEPVKNINKMDNCQRDRKKQKSIKVKMHQIFRKIKKVGRSKECQRKTHKKWKQFVLKMKQKNSGEQLSRSTMHKDFSIRIGRIKQVKLVKGKWTAIAVDQLGFEFPTLRDQLRIRCPELLLQFYEKMVQSQRNAVE